MANSTRMKQLYRRLAEAGFSTQFLRKQVLPSTWQDNMADDDRYQNLLAFLSRNLAISRESFENISTPLSFDNSRTRFFKGSDITEEADAGLQLIQGIARIAISGMPLSSTASILSASAVRRRILETGQPWVGFRALLSFCWNSHIPVIHMENLPAQSRRMRGIAIETEGRSAIALCQKYHYPARHLVPLAHEIGHLASQHMDFIGLMASTVDEIRFNERTEAEAHRYATELLTGGQVISPNYQRYRHPQNLVDAVYEQSNAKKIDPGYLIVRRAGDTGDWREASIALSIIEGEESAIALINNEVKRHIDASSLSAASRSFFTNITGVNLVSRAGVSTTITSSNTLPLQQPSSPQPPLYPISLLQRYKALVRQGYIGELSPDQNDQLAIIREEIQAISQGDERAQAAVRMAQDVNASLDALEMQIDARIAQREAEQRDEAGQTT